MIVVMRRIGIMDLSTRKRRRIIEIREGDDEARLRTLVRSLLEVMTDHLPWNISEQNEIMTDPEG
jgi:hypothetical protein